MWHSTMRKPKTIWHHLSFFFSIFSSCHHNGQRHSGNHQLHTAEEGLPAARSLSPGSSLQAGRASDGSRVAPLPPVPRYRYSHFMKLGKRRKKRKGHCSLEGVSYILTPPFSLRPGSGSKEKKMLTCSAVKLNPGRKTTRHLVLFSLSLSFFSCTVSANQSKHEECDRW